MPRIGDDSKREWMECGLCCGEGEIPHDCGEDICCCDDSDDEVCPDCDGKGGHMVLDAKRLSEPYTLQESEK